MCVCVCVCVCVCLIKQCLASNNHQGFFLFHLNK